MSLDPAERLAALRREVDAEQSTATRSAPARSDATSAPEANPAHKANSAPAPLFGPSAPSAAAPADPDAGDPPDADVSPTIDSHDGWELGDLLADTSLTTWLGIGLVAVGGYLVLSWFVPGIDLIGSIILLGAGVVLLVQHLQRGVGAWALYAGAILVGLGAGRAIGDILPGSPRGLSAMGIGLAFLAIAYLRHTQAGGHGWQGTLGAAVLGLGVLQLVLGLLPGSPSIIDLVLPALLLLGGGLLIGRTRRPPTNA